MDENLPDLSYLSESERKKIIEVLKKDDILRKKQTEKFYKLRAEIDLIESKSLDIPSEHVETARVCIRCQDSFGYFFNTGAFCPKCGYKVCSKCRVNQMEVGLSNIPWLCILCHKYNEYLVQTGEWINLNESYESKMMTNDMNETTQSRSVRSPSTYSVNNPTRPHYYGSQLIKISLFPNKKSEILEEIQHTNLNSSTLTRKYSNLRCSVSNQATPPYFNECKSHNQIEMTVINRQNCMNSSASSRSSSRSASLDPTNDSSNMRAATKTYLNDNRASIASRLSLQSAKEREKEKEMEKDKDKEKYRNVFFSGASAATTAAVAVADMSASHQHTLKPMAENDLESMTSSEVEKASATNEFDDSNYIRHQMNYRGTNATETPDEKRHSNAAKQLAKVDGNETSNEKRGIEIINIESYLNHEINKSGSSSPTATTFGPYKQNISRTSTSTTKKAFDFKSHITAQAQNSASRSGDLSASLASAKSLRVVKSSTKQINKSNPQTQTQNSANESDSDNEDMNHMDQIFANARESLRISNKSKESEKTNLSSPTTPNRELAVDIHSLSSPKSLRSSFKFPHLSIANRKKNLSLQRSKSSKSINDSSKKEQQTNVQSLNDLSYLNDNGKSKVCLEFNYERKSSNLSVKVFSCQNLPCVNKKHSCDSYVKLYLMHDNKEKKDSKRKTSIKKNTCNPIFDEVIRYTISFGDIESHTLWVSVWNSDTFGRNKLIGDVHIQLDQLSLFDQKLKYFDLTDKINDDVIHE